MAPKKITDQLRVARQSPLSASPEEGNYNDPENPPPNQEGALNPTFDPIVASLLVREKYRQSRPRRLVKKTLQPVTFTFSKSRRIKKSRFGSFSVL
jgi:hypothetical protein